MPFIHWGRIRSVLAILCLCLFGLTAHAAQDGVVRVGMLALRGVDVATRMWTPVMHYLEERLPGRRFELVPLAYGELFPAVEKGQVDFIFTAAGQYVELELRYGVSRIVTLLNTGPNGDFSEYGGILVTRADRRDIVSIDDLRGKTLLIPDRLSFGGFLMQWRELRALGLEPDRDFSIAIAGNNEKSIRQLLENKGDVGAARTDVFESMVKEGMIRAEDFRFLMTPGAPQHYPYAVSTRLYPEWAFAKLPQTSDDLSRQVAIALMQMPRDSAAARSAEIVGWTVPKNYQPVLELFKDLRIGPFARSGFSLDDFVQRYWQPLLGAGSALFLVLAAGLVWVVRAKQAVVEEKARSETYLDLIGTMIVVLDTSARIVRVNRRTSEVLGYAERDLVGRDWIDVAIPEGQRPRFHAAFAEVIAGRRTLRGDHLSEMITADGGTRLIRWSNRLIRDASGKTTSVISAGEDVTEQRRAESQVRLFAQVFQRSVEGVVICDTRGDIVSVNPAFSEITGYSADDVLGKNPALLKSGRHEPEFYRRMWETVAESGLWQGEVWNRRKDGSIYPEWLSISTLRDDRGAVANYIGVFSDISRQKADQERIHFLAYYDALTHLPNRSLLVDRFDQAAAMAQRSGRHLAVLFIDLDRFKQVNDSLGHQMGDELLKIVADRFTSCVRDSDTVARLGGDEFILLLPDLADIDDAVVVAEKCVDVLRLPAIIGGHELHVTPSIGIAVCPQDGETLDALVKNADTAMYAAKDAGRNTFQFFTNDMNARIFARMLLENELRLALERGEFVLHYQPQVDIATGDIIGVEALVRWQHPTQGLVFPGAFISVAEDCGLITALGDWVLREACRQNAAWQAAGLPPMVVAVNVSAPQFRMRDFYASVGAALSLAALDSHWLELELTESILIQDVDETLALLGDIKQLGVSLSVDDFGTGYSSLSYLKRFPVDKLKVDQSFVRDLTTDADDHAIAASIIAMGHRLGLRVIAEGVETVEHLDILRAEGCDEYQGYLFSKPVPAAAITQRLKDLVEATATGT